MEGGKVVVEMKGRKVVAETLKTKVLKVCIRCANYTH
jgi:hypothetical protein